METIRNCPGCGRVLAPDAPAGLCPVCLLQTAPGDSQATGMSPEDLVRPASPQPGQAFGDYRIVRLLGQGGMGEVYEAEHVVTGRPVAVKVMRHALNSEADRKRFLREGRLAASVNHPNVVYLYGTEEIEGVPVMVMELVRDGTLKDRLKAVGPLDITEAVEATLQVMAGLEAAHQAGVLHRDIKPANCFVAADGTVKVGDFGLSISTLARGESLLTASGSVLGTPAYASPEQLRGEQLDARSDIYSLGCTLYHLLTGRTPFTGTDFVKLITEVLDKPPVSPHSVRPEIPRGLVQVILRCLAKDRKARYSGYAALREALLPFAGGASEPATPAKRFLASVLDEAIAYAPSLLFLVYTQVEPLEEWMAARTLSALLIWLPFGAWYLLYYALTEGLWGAGVGKTLCRLRVVGPDRHRPGMGRAGLRAAIYLLPYFAPALLLMLASPAEDLRAALARGEVLVTDWLWLPLLASLFLTMRRSNGHAAVHDLLSRTRVVVRPTTQPRPVLRELLPPVDMAETLSAGPGPMAAAHLGPYEVRSLLGQEGPEQLLLAVDPALQRSVWVHLRPAGAERVTLERRVLGRPGRLRWLTGGQTATHLWDAYQAVDGAPLLAAARRAVPWRAVQFWLLDLSTELAQAAEGIPGNPMPALDRVWVAANGHALLLDFRCPGLPADPSQASPPPLEDVQSTQRFLAAVAASALEGSTEPRVQPARQAFWQQPTLPLPARGFLEHLARGAFDRSELIVGNLRSLVGKPAEVSRPWRVASLAFGPMLAIGLGLLTAGMLAFENLHWERTWARAYPGKPSLRVASNLLADQVERSFMMGDQLERTRAYVHHHFRSVITDEAFWKHPRLNAILTEHQRALLRQVVAEPPATPPESLAQAEQEISALMQREARGERLTPLALFAGLLVFGALLEAVVELAGALTLGISPTLRLFGIAVVDRTGAPATRRRLCWRWLLVWSPLLLVASVGTALVLIALPGLTTEPPTRWWIAALVAFVGVALGGLSVVLHAALHPTRGPVDRLASTCLVPR